MSSKPSKTTKRVTVVVTDAHPLDPAWDGVRQTLANILTAGRQYLEGQAYLGWQLFHLKKEHGVHRGRPKINSAESAELRTWPEIVKAETGLERRTADELIRLYESSLAKLRKVKKKQAPGLIAIFQSANPLAMPAQQRAEFQGIIASLCTGETQGSMMAELGVVPKPKPIKKGEESKEKGAELTAGELARMFFSSVAAPILSARTNPDYMKLLASLPPESTEENPVSLAGIEAELRAMLADIEEVKPTTLKDARKKSA